MVRATTAYPRKTDAERKKVDLQERLYIVYAPHLCIGDTKNLHYQSSDTKPTQSFQT